MGLNNKHRAAVQRNTSYWRKKKYTHPSPQNSTPQLNCIFQEEKSIISCIMLFLAKVANNFSLKPKLIILILLEKGTVKTAWKKKNIAKTIFFLWIFILTEQQ